MLFQLFLLIVAVCVATVSSAATCESYGKDTKKCLANSEDGVKCASCSSAAAGTNCMKETDAQGLPSSVFQCTYQSSSYSSGMNSTLTSDTVISCSPHDADACNCVYYARDRQPKLPTGCTTCGDKKNMANTQTAKVGCVLFRTGDPTYCHAAYVTGVSSTTVTYEQANWTPCKCSRDSLSISSSAIIGYWCP